MSGCTVKFSVTNIGLLIIIKRHYKVPFITKQEEIRNQWSTISAHWTPYNLSIQLSAKSYTNIVQKR